MSKINVGIAMVKVPEGWGIDHIYDIPGGSSNSIMDALYQEETEINYIQVRHEEVGTLAAAADAELTGKVDAIFGSARPSVTHLVNGLYDTQMDHVPLVAFLGQIASASMSYNSSQELNGNPIFAGVSVYSRTVATPQSLPRVIGGAIKAAYEHKGVTIMTISVDLGFKEIGEQSFSTAHTHETSVILPEEKDLLAALPYLEKAKKPVPYVDQGVRNGFPQIKEFSEHFSVPAVASVLTKGIISDDYKNFLGFTGRVVTKPGNEVLTEVDPILFVGSDFLFGHAFFNPAAEFIQVDIDASELGRRHGTSLPILGNADTALQRLVELGDVCPTDSWYLANQENKEKWVNWLKSFKGRREEPIRLETVYKEISRIVEDDAIFITDAGNTTIHSVRLLNMNSKQKHTASGWFVATGNGVPGGVAAQLSYPEKQVFTLSGDGGFAMVTQDIITQVKHQFSIINIVFSGVSLGFIKAEQEDTERKKFGVFLEDADFGKVGEALGAGSFTVTEYSQLQFAFDAAVRSDHPVIIDVKINNKRPLPVEDPHLSPRKYSEEGIQAFKEKYEVHDLSVLNELYEERLW